MTAVFLLATIVVVQAALITGLVWQQRRARRIDAGLRDSEARFRQMANDAPVMMWTATPDTLVDFCNSPVIEFTGLPLEELLGEGWLRRVHPDDVEAAKSLYAPAFEARVPFQIEYRLRRADGVYRWILDAGVPRSGADGSFAGYVGAALDITERKEMEDSLIERQVQLQDAYERNRDLAGRLINAQEMERTRIARDLHDDLSQQLAALAILTSNLKLDVASSGSGADAARAFGLLQEQVTAVAENIRNLSHELHPGVLELAGLAPALKRLCSDVERRHGLTVNFQAPEDLEGLTPEVALCLFRVAQEALTNAVRHAKPRTILVELLSTLEGVRLGVVDDGVGFELADRHGQGLGLRSIDERVRLNRGSLQLHTRPGTGTKIQVLIPQDSVAHRPR